MSNSSDPHSGETVVLLPFGLSPEDLDALKKECRLLRFVPGEPKSRKESRLGGLPYLRVNATWPVCKHCGEPMLFLLQCHGHDVPGLPAEHVLTWFICNRCKPWFDNTQERFRVFLLPFDDEVERMPLDETPLFAKEVLPEPSGIQIRQETDYPDADDLGNALKTPAQKLAYARAHEPHRQHKVGGYPFWSFKPDVPRCEACGEPMSFFAQLASEDAANLHFRDEGHALLFHCTREECQHKHWGLVVQD